MKKILLAAVLLAGLFWSALIVKAQIALALVLVIGAALAAGTVVWIYAQNATEVNIRWVVMEGGTIGGPWTPVLTNKAIIGPKVFKDFPIAYIYTTNTHRWYRVRLARDEEIPQNFKVTKIPGSDIQPVIYTDAELIEIRDRLNRENRYPARAIP